MLFDIIQTADGYQLTINGFVTHNELSKDKNWKVHSQEKQKNNCLRSRVSTSALSRLAKWEALFSLNRTMNKSEMASYSKTLRFGCSEN